MSSSAGGADGEGALGAAVQAWAHSLGADSPGGGAPDGVTPLSVGSEPPAGVGTSVQAEPFQCRSMARSVPLEMAEPAA
jgi:hypothetical protein